MKLLTVIPIAKAIQLDELTYFSNIDVAAGDLVEIPLRSKKAVGLVVKVTDASEAKSEIKELSFAMRKIDKRVTPSFLSPAFMMSATEAAAYFGATMGATLHALVPKMLITEKNIPEVADVSFTPQDQKKEKSIVQAGDEERLIDYKSFIRETFARHASVFFCLPTMQDIKHVLASVPKGIEQFTFVFHSGLSQKTLRQSYEKMMAEKHPVLIIATGSYFALSRKDIGVIIIEKENSPAYKMQTRPYVDIRTFAEIFARHSGARLIVGDLLLRIETLWRYNEGEFTEFAPLKFRSLSTATHAIVDMRTQIRNETDATHSHVAVSAELEEFAKQNKEQSEHLFIFSARRGLAPITVCRTCGDTLLCERCSTPIVLHERGSRFFLCHKCGERAPADTACRKCGGLNLLPLGIGADRVESAIQKGDLYNTFLLTKDSAKTHKGALAIVDKFYNTPGSILIGTELALPYLDRPIENVAVASIDALFAIPDFRINEKIVHILLKLKQRAQKKMLVQTRNPDRTLFDFALRGTLLDFYRQEIEERKTLDYPPFSLLIKITRMGEKSAVAADMEKLKEIFKGETLIVFPAFTDTVGGKYVMHCVIKMPRASWVKPALSEKLKNLSPAYSVKVEPESLL